MARSFLSLSIVLASLLLVVGGLSFGCGSVSAAMNLAAQSHSSSTNRQAPNNSVSSLVVSAGQSANSLRKIILPALNSLVGAPLRLIRQLIIELVAYIRSHSIAELYSMKTLQKFASALPERARTYWMALSEMESQCMHRTVCDLSNFASTRLPKWASQVLLIYLNAFSESHPYYQVAINGATAHQCQAMYGECNAEDFLARVRGNLTSTVSSTLAPLNQAINELVNITTTTLSSLTVDKSSNDRLQPESSPVLSRPEVDMSRFDIFEDDQDDDERREFVRGPSGPSRDESPMAINRQFVQQGFHPMPQAFPQPLPMRAGNFRVQH